MKEVLQYLKENKKECEGLEEILYSMPCAYVAQREDIAPFFKGRKRNSNKSSYGSACIVAGSERYLGAAALSVASALRSGCGYVYAVVPQGLKCALAAAYPQAIYVEEPILNASAVAFGMGLGCNENVYQNLCNILKNYKGKLIIDADGLNCLAKFGKDILKESKAEILLTPHPGEMARLCNSSVDKVVASPMEEAQKFANEYNVNIYLKNAASVIVDNEGAVVQICGCSALAKAGSGDILSGFICGNAARGLDLKSAALASGYVMGLSAQICSETMYEGGVTAEEIIKNLPVAVKRLTD